MAALAAEPAGHSRRGTICATGPDRPKCVFDVRHSFHMRSLYFLGFLAFLGVASLAYPQEISKPGRFAKNTEKMDWLVSAWKGRSFEELLSIWGAPPGEHLSPAANPVYVYSAIEYIPSFETSTHGVINAPRVRECIVEFEVLDDHIVDSGYEGEVRMCASRFWRDRQPSE